MQFVETKNLEPGMRLAKPIYNKDGVLLYDRNAILTAPGIHSIHNFELIGIFILEPAEPLPPITPEELEFEQFQTIHMFRLREIITKIVSGELPEGLPLLVQSILKRYGSLDHKIFFSQTLRSSSDFVYKHSLSTAILAALIAHFAHFPESMKESLIYAALLYDIGYLFVPREILDKGNRLSEDDWKVITECRERGYQLLSPSKNIYHLPKKTLELLPQINYVVNPANQFKLNQVSWMIGSQILFVADMFDRNTAMNLGHTPISELAAMRILYSQPKRYEKPIVDALAQCIHILPAGCSIDLSNGHKGIVLAENPEHFLEPLILDIKNNQVYDLSNQGKHSDIEITDIMKTMDNRIEIAPDAMQFFQADEHLKETVKKFKSANSSKKLS